MKLPSFFYPIRLGQYLGTCISEDNVELSRIIVQNPQEVERAKPQVRKGSQVEKEKPNGFSNQRELAVAKSIDRGL